MSNKDIGIDLGTANTLIYHKSKGVVLNEPSVVAVSTSDGRILSVGKEAKDMLGRTHLGIKAVCPLAEGVISDFDYAVSMLDYFIKKVYKSSAIIKPRALISVPASVTSVERKATVEAASRAGIRRAALIDEPMAAAIGANVDVDAPSGVMVVNIGYGTSETAVISLGGIVARKTVKIAGASMDSAIISYIRKKYGISTGNHSAEDVKMKIGTVLKSSEKSRYPVSGRNYGSGLPYSTYVSGDDIRTALLPSVYAIVDSIKQTLEGTPPELASDVLQSGIILTGGGALIDGIDRLICRVTGMPVRIDDTPLESVINGLGILVNNKEKCKKLFK